MGKLVSGNTHRARVLCAGALSFALWSYALARLPVAQVSSSLYLVPVLTFPIAWVWMGEVPGMASLAGDGIVLLGVLLAQMRGSDPVSGWSRYDHRPESEQ